MGTNILLFVQWYSDDAHEKPVNTDTIIKRTKKFDKDLVALLFTKAGEGRNLDPASGFFNDSNNILLVAYTNGIPSGFLYAYILSSLKTPYPKMFLYSIDVFENYRRKGIASNLVTELKKLANLNHCSEIFVLTNKSNEPAMNLYTKTGASVENNDDVLFVYDRVNNFSM
jgi:ribosomal protein S18 acetylase RimI-like enzyme